MQDKLKCNQWQLCACLKGRPLRTYLSAKNAFKFIMS